MWRRRLALVLAAVVVLGAAGPAAGRPDPISTDLVNKNVETNVDLTTQLVKIGQKLTLENTGKASIKSFLLAAPVSQKPRVSFLAAKAGEHALRVVETTAEGHSDKAFWRVELRSDLAPGRSVQVSVDSVLVRSLAPHPSQITQREKQLVLYEGNAYFFSPYRTEKQQQTVTLGTSGVESFTRVQPVAQQDGRLTYGPFEQVAPFSEERISVHFENNAPFLTITRLERLIEVSHWGNIAVEETVDVEHRGATLKGSFSRYEYQREAQSGLSSVKSWRTALPASAADVYYRDEIGNISTSHLRVLSDSVELELRPRFPLFGGWKTHYVLGYNVPSYEYLFNQGERFVLKMRLLDHVLDDMLVEHLVTKVILPEGCHSLELATPYGVQRLPDELHFTYLDTKGRPVVSVEKRNLVENHIDDFELRYVHARVLMFQEPLLLVCAFFALFLLVILYVRIDFSISGDDDASSGAAASREHKDK